MCRGARPWRLAATHNTRRLVCMLGVPHHEICPHKPLFTSVFRSMRHQWDHAPRPSACMVPLHCLGSAGRGAGASDGEGPGAAGNAGCTDGLRARLKASPRLGRPPFLDCDCFAPTLTEVVDLKITVDDDDHPFGILAADEGSVLREEHMGSSGH